MSIQPFLADIRPDFEPLVRQIDELMTGLGCAVGVKEAKSGHVVSYSHPGTGKAVANLVARKAGPQVRIYGDFAADYPALVEALPDALADRIAKASDCRRLLDPTKCNARCATGYDLTLWGERHRKCRYACFLFPVTAESLPHILALLGEEMRLRSA